MKLVALVFAFGIIGIFASDANGQCYGGGGYGYYGGHRGYHGGYGHYRPHVNVHYRSYPRYYHGYRGHHHHHRHYGHGHGHGHGHGYIRYGQYGGHSGFSFGIGF